VASSTKSKESLCLIIENCLFDCFLSSGSNLRELPNNLCFHLSTMIPSKERIVRPQQLVVAPSRTLMVEQPKPNSDYSYKAKNGWLVPSQTTAKRPAQKRSTAAVPMTSSTKKASRSRVVDDGIRVRPAGMNTSTSRPQGIKHPGGDYSLKGKNGYLVTSR